MDILADEFSRQAIMESDLRIQSSLMGKPSKERAVLFQSQLNFMNLFAIPLFQGVADILPAMKFCVDELDVNKKQFETEIAQHQSQAEALKLAVEGAISPRSTSPDTELQERFDTEPGKALAPAAVIVENRSDRDEQPFTPAISPLSSPAVTKSAHTLLPEQQQQQSPNAGYHEVNGIVTTFDAVADFAASDPFHMNENDAGDGGGGSGGGLQQHHHHQSSSTKQQRCSETTEGTSSSLPYSGGDWQSQATSATTGKMPLSPSTQATSDVSRDSIDGGGRPSSLPVATNTAATVYPPAAAAEAAAAPDGNSSIIKMHPETKVESHPAAADDDLTLSVPTHHEGKLLKKKSSSRFIPHFSFFKRHKGNPPPVPTADTAG